ncbi:hypothetical protein AWR36_013775 [Microbulbifer flavimaris]|uniref:DUF6249 domain-containing protein n=1 Tax=Microbulbifer flavimaris TaxID=1781068 RepID=A0ABX4HXX6_9GAMM|nr:MULTISPECIES: DUF6249 domain-containing protein [Microbulbifer]KUJ81601.1 hypothetical protein AVO43_13740 [Microbulbifer sp. ZGT114]PCO04510.1 hypothetical protein AWR36_013775 [Microbulbifer flavimaris]
MNEGTLALLIPFALFLLVGLLVWMALYFRQKSNREVQETIRLALEKDNPLTPTLIEHLASYGPHPKRDIRIGIVWVAIALGLALMGFFTPDPSGNAFKGMLAVAAIPLMVGIAYLVMSRITTDRPAV